MAYTVYALIKNGRVIYIGQTGQDIVSRAREHRHCGVVFDWIAPLHDGITTRTEARALESQLIQAIGPDRLENKHVKAWTRLVPLAVGGD